MKEMQIVTPGLVLRTVQVGEADRILTLFTPEYGIITASAKGCMRPKSKLAGGCGLFCYSEFVLFRGRTMFKVNEVQPRQQFHGIAASIEATALAMYLSEIAMALNPAGPETERQLRLLLNSLYLISRGEKDLRLIKAVYELRSVSEMGYMPDLVCCRICGKYDGGAFYFDTLGGTLMCGECAGKQGLVPNLTAAALTALRYIVLVEDHRIFSFSLAGEGLESLARASQSYLLACLDRPFKSLEFLNTVLPLVQPDPPAGEAAPAAP